jgi:hypothetical protein
MAIGPYAQIKQHRRGSTVDHARFTGAPGEFSMDTTKKTVVVHDGYTQGGIPLPSPVAPGLFIQGTQVTWIVALTQAAYDALTDKNPTFLYVIIPSTLIAETGLFVLSPIEMNPPIY